MPHATGPKGQIVITSPCGNVGINRSRLRRFVVTRTSSIVALRLSPIVALRMSSIIARLELLPRNVVAFPIEEVSARRMIVVNAHVVVTAPLGSGIPDAMRVVLLARSGVSQAFDVVAVVRPYGAEVARSGNTVDIASEPGVAQIRSTLREAAFRRNACPVDLRRPIVRQPSFRAERRTFDQPPAAESVDPSSNLARDLDDNAVG